MRKKTNEEVVFEFKNVHKDINGDGIYDYSLFEYETTHKKDKIICLKHGIFEQSAANHLRGQGCPECYKESKIKWNQETFLNAAYEIHGNENYIYGNDFIDFKTKMKIYCNRHNEYFYKTPFKHITQKQGCPKCGYTTYNIKNFISESKKIHGEDRYDYSSVIIKNNSIPVEIICYNIDENGNEHGSFFIKPILHINRKFGCPKCKSNKKLDLSIFIERSNESHKDCKETYDYSKVEYQNISTKVCIICSEHGEFYQTPWKHMVGHRCPKCSSIYSKNELELYDYIKQIYPKEIIHHHKLNNRTEIDVFIPELNIGFEYNGTYWHCDKNRDKNYHYDKVTAAQNEGIRLIHIWDYEWINNHEHIKSYIKAQLGLCEHRIFARKCEVREINFKTAKLLLEYHQQKATAANHYIGLYYDNELVLVMLFGKNNNNGNKKIAEWEVKREVCKEGYSVVGGKSKVFSYFVKKYNPKSIVSYVDRSKFTGKSYEILGFELSHIVQSRYDWVYENSLIFKKRQPRIYKKMKQLYEENKVMRIYDSGRYCYIWKNN